MRIKHLFLFSLFFLIMSCEKEVEPNLVSAHKEQRNLDSYHQDQHPNYISIDSLPILKSYLGIYTSTNLKGGKKLPLGLSLEMDKVKVMEDVTEKRMNYSIRLTRDAKNSSKSFFGLIVSQDEDGNAIEDFVIEYIMSESFYKDFTSGLVEITDFTGEINFYTTSKSSSLSDDSKSDAACSSNNICGGTSGGSGSTGAPSGGGTTTSSGSASGGGCTAAFSVVPCTGNDGKAQHTIGERCSCTGSNGCNPASAVLVVSCEQFFDGGGCTLNGTFPIPNPDFDSNGDVVEDIDGEVQEIANLLEFGRLSDAWFLFQNNEQLRRSISSLAKECNRSDDNKIDEISDVLHEHFLDKSNTYRNLNADLAGAGSIIWPIVKDLMIEIIWEAGKSQIPGVKSYDDFLDLMKGISQGDLLAVLGEIIDIAKKEGKGLVKKLFLPAVIIDVGINIGDKAIKLSRHYDELIILASKYSQDVLSGAYALIKKVPLETKFNSALFAKLTKAISRSTKSVDEIFDYVTLPNLDKDALKHIFDGNPVGHPNPSGGFHDISAFAKRTDIEILEIKPKGNKGVMEVIAEYPNGQRPPKTIFPLDWDEKETIKQIESAYKPGNMTKIKDGVYEGVSDSKVKIRFNTIGGETGTIKSAFPVG